MFQYRKKGRMIFCVLSVMLLFALSLTGCGKNKKDSGSDGQKEEQSTQATTEAADNSVPVTELKVTAPANNMRVGEELQLEISMQPADATNPKLQWSIYDIEEGSGEDAASEESTGEGSADVDSNAAESDAAEYIEISSDGVLTADTGAEKHTVKVLARTTDGSGLEQSFTLRIYPEIDPSKPMVAVTFDDGPNPSTTNVMLDALEENYAKATFFVLGSCADEYPETVKREYDLGMEVGTHTYSHTQLTTLTGSALEKEVSDSIEAIVKADGVEPTLMRPPYGSYNDEVRNVVKSYGLCCVNWSLDTEDWKTKNADATYKMVMTAVDGDVILLHDIHQYNVEAVQRFVPDLIEAGFQLVTVPELYAARGESLEPGTVHFRTDPTTEAVEETSEADLTEDDQLLDDGDNGDGDDLLLTDDGDDGDSQQGAEE